MSLRLVLVTNESVVTRGAIEVQGRYFTFIDNKGQTTRMHISNVVRIEMA